MDMVSDTGAITDINEIAAGMVSELTSDEMDTVNSLSMEELLDDLSNDIADVGSLQTNEVEELGLTPTLESLLNVVEGIRATGSISRADASMLSSMTASMEGFEDSFKNMPLASFTEVPSKVNFQPSMENILVKAGRAILEFIKKIIKWIREKATALVTYVKGNVFKAKKMEAAATKTEEDLKEAGEVFKAGDPVSKAKTSSDTFTKKSSVQIPSIAYNSAKVSPFGIGEMAGALTGISKDISSIVMRNAFNGLPVESISSKLSILAKRAFDGDFKIDAGSDFDSVMEALSKLAKEFVARKDDVDVFQWNMAETHSTFTIMVATFNKSKFLDGATTISVNTSSTIKLCANSSASSEAYVAKAVREGVRLDSNDEKVKDVERYKKLVKATEDVNTIFSVVCAVFVPVLKFSRVAVVEMKAAA